MTSVREMLQKLESYFIQDRTILAAYLFGSFSRGRQRPGSDVDIALLLDEHGGKTDRKLLLDRLHQDLGRLLRNDVHILILNDASYVARIEALFRGRCIHAKDEDALAQFKMLTASLYADFAPYLEEQHRRLKKRLGVDHHGQ